MYKVIVEKGSLHFSAAHFILFGGKCERLHGHNYAVSVELEGNLTEDRYVFDFVALKENVRQICNSLDHYFLLPQLNKDLRITKTDEEWEIRFENRRYVLPAGDVLALPVDNVTAERLAEYICGRLIEALHEYDVSNLTSVTVGVEEAPGQTAFYRHLFSREVAW